MNVQSRMATYSVTGEGRPLLFLPGWSSGGRSYARCLRGLGDNGWRVYAPALPGFGGTADLPAAAFSLPGYAAWVAEFVRQVCPGCEPLPVIGHSFGGGVAIQTAHDAPELVDRLIVVNSVGGANWTSRGNVLRTVHDRPLWDWGLHLAGDSLMPWQLTRLLPVVLPDFAASLLRNPGALWRVGRLAARVDLTVELTELKRRRTPIVIIWGQGDRFLPRLALQSLRQVTDAPCVTVEGNHTWMLTRPDIFCEAISNLLPGPVAGPVPS